MSLQQKLQALRKEKGLTQEEFAETIGVSRQAVAKWEAGQSYPDLDRLIEISNLYKVSIDKLVKDCKENCSFNEEKTYKDYADNEMICFLCKAKKVTYAGSGSETVSSRPNSHDLEYTEGNLKYIDTYLGGEKFVGEEALWKDNVPVWSMNYIGRIIDEGFSGSFLKAALSLVSKDYPYRGPMVYANGDYIYHCIVNGEFNWFQGYEEIFYNNNKIYECFFHGGSVK
ncbi:DUF5680 domain-containing protein [Clostridium cellulovorans]|uniref:Helix-turn-helix domain protein n=1 Tax=Clostridium cellulovorans (strain ATCC 35296 / DSM 3052 / OCM 3 / 743B) TaxID=573061 RepID=D9SQM6_CLOC7|nr:DUF5680 domain-containing protein [Clostridium cellulovorans]ADL52232.1 helix-turn-helix domain protein [Clostridium cellulovorans 743B]